MYQIEFFKTPSGKDPIKEFILSLPPDQQAKSFSCLDLLMEYGYQLRSPHSKKLSGYQNLFELRTSGSSPVRFIYTINKNIYLILNAFVKKTNKTPKQEIYLALKRIPN